MLRLKESFGQRQLRSRTPVADTGGPVIRSTTHARSIGLREAFTLMTLRPCDIPVVAASTAPATDNGAIPIRGDVTHR